MPRKFYLRTLSDYPPPTPQPTPCRLWQGYCDRWGYGIRGDTRRQHVWAWEQAHGPVPAGMCVLHHCDNPPCYRLDHLWLGTRGDNARDRDRKGRNVPGPGRGHKKGTG